MIYIAGIFCFVIFLFSLYILVKDDYVFIRKNISLDHLFDFTFIGVISGLIVARILAVLFHPLPGQGFMSQFFSMSWSGMTLTEVVAGCILAFYLVAKFKKVPIGRLFDFLTLAFLTSLPAGYLLNILSVSKREIIIYLFLSIIYIIINVVFWKYLLKRMVNNIMKEGSLSSLFFIVFSALALIVSLIGMLSTKTSRIGAGDILLVCLLVGSVIVYIRNERKKAVRRKM